MPPFPEGVELQHFVPGEFDRPDKVDPELLELLDEVRARCGFPIKVNSDVRDPEDTAGPHAIHDDGWGHAVDVQPAGSLEFSEFHTRKMEIACTAFWMGPARMGVWPNQGVEVGTQHVHLDTSPDLKRPYYWGARSE